jgi:hypothetical protein
MNAVELIVPWLVALGSVSAHDARCSLPVFFGGPYEDVIYVHALATGTARTVAVGADFPFRGGSDSEDAPHRGNVPDSSQAFEFRVIASAGGAATPAVGDLIRVVPWGYSEDCSPQAWTQGSWIDKDEEVVLTFAGASATPSLGAFHVRGAVAAYPQGAWHRVRGGTHPEPGPGAHWMSAEEFFRLMITLPPRRATERAEVRGEHQRMIQTIESSPWDHLYPASELLRMSHGVLARPW